MGPQFLKPVVSKSKSLQNLVMASPREINPRVKPKNKNLSSKTELNTSTENSSTTKTSTTKTFTTKTSTTKTLPKTSTNTSSRKTSLTVLMPKLSNDQILPS